MKKIILLFLTINTSIEGFCQTSMFTLAGNVNKVKAPVVWVYISYLVNGKRIIDSAEVKLGNYSFSGNITEPVQASLRSKYFEDINTKGNIPFNVKRDYAIIFLQPGNMAVSSVDSFSNVIVTGSKADEAYRDIQKKAVFFNEKLDELYNKYKIAKKAKNDILIPVLEKQIDEINEEANEKVYGDYVKQYPSSPLALYALKNWAGYNIDAAKIAPVFNSLPLALQNTTSGKEMREKILLAQKTGIGQMAMDFTQNDTSANPISLSSFFGKYVLIDFWASWCSPCRIENVKLVEVYNKYKNKGFNILGVSLDKPGDKQKWLNAINSDGLNWVHVSDLLFWDNKVAVKYGINAIPQNLLLDPKGKIIAKNIKVDDLLNTLRSIFTD